MHSFHVISRLLWSLWSVVPASAWIPALAVVAHHLQILLLDMYQTGLYGSWSAVGMVYVNLYSAIVANVSNALGTLVLGKQPSFQALFERSKVLLCAEVVRQRVPNRRAKHSECSAANSGEPVSWHNHQLNTQTADLAKPHRCQFAFMKWVTHTKTCIVVTMTT